MASSDVLRHRKRERATASSHIGYTLTRRVVQHHNAPNDAWVIVRGGVYDVTTFLESHPGGADVLRDSLGGDATKAMGDDGVHAHSAYAYKLLEKYRIGTLAEEGGSKGANADAADAQVIPQVDWTRPILPQVGELGDDYLRWIHSFPTTEHTVKMFASDTVEALTKCAWYMPLLFWVPTILFELWRYTRFMGGVSEIDFVHFGLVAATGALCWLLFEYVLHRYLFHLPTNGYYSNIFHFLIHGHHHITPMDFDRLVFPPVPALLIAAPFWAGAPRVMGVATGYPWLIGFAIGYLVYDMTHFFIHHGVPKSSFMRSQKRRHVFHHYFNPDCNFGISNPLFDYAFRTIKEPQQ